MCKKKSVDYVEISISQTNRSISELCENIGISSSLVKILTGEKNMENTFTVVQIFTWGHWNNKSKEATMII